MTAVVNTVRDLLTRQRAGHVVWIAVAWCAGILVVAGAAASISYRRRIS